MILPAAGIHRAPVQMLPWDSQGQRELPGRSKLLRLGIADGGWSLTEIPDSSSSCAVSSSICLKDWAKAAALVESLFLSSFLHSCKLESRRKTINVGAKKLALP
jgi:hypothetical protein